MNVNDFQAENAGAVGAANDKDTGLKTWIRPELTRLRAGAAESSPGSTIFDGALENIGS
jgi:hypothetical protein